MVNTMHSIFQIRSQEIFTRQRLMKRTLQTKYYIRYADDFAIFHEDKSYLENLIPQISDFLETRLKLSLHPNKVYIQTLASGVDFLGWIHFPDHRVIRTATKRRMWKRIKEVDGKKETVDSYVGLLSHGNARKLTGEMLAKYKI